MPEGPSIVILKEAVQSFKGKIVKHAIGNTKKVDIKKIEGKKVIDFKSWGKHFLICFSTFTIRIHFMLFGSYRVNEGKDTEPRLSLKFNSGELNFYSCSVKFIDTPLDQIYDWSSDVMSEYWSEEKALHKLKEVPDALVCDVLLDQQIFSGVGNIIKNEVLFRIRVHPESLIKNLSLIKRKELIREAVKYSYQFKDWKKEFTLKKQWLVHTKSICPRDHIPLRKA